MYYETIKGQGQFILFSRKRKCSEKEQKREGEEEEEEAELGRSVDCVKRICFCFLGLMDGSGGREEEDVHMDAGDGGGTDSAAVGAAAIMYSSTDYTQYNVYGHLIEVPSKYCPPIQPIGRGAYGIVWLDLQDLFFFVFLWFFATSCLSPTIVCVCACFVLVCCLVVVCCGGSDEIFFF